MAISEAKLKGKGFIQFGLGKGLISVVNERMTAKGVGLLMKEKLWECVYEFKCVSSKIMWVKMEVRSEKWVVVSVYGPGSERNREERLDF